MTYSIIGRCARTGRVGQAIATFAIATGGRFEGFRADAGICKTMAIPVRENDVLAVRLMAQGFTPRHALQMIERNDPGYANRQIVLMDLQGGVAAHTGAARPWCGHRTGDGVVAAGNMLAGPQVVDAMVETFASLPDIDLPERLLRALEAGDAAGGQRGPDGRAVPARSAALRVASPGAHSLEVDLRVDLHDESVRQLRVFFSKA